MLSGGLFLYISSDGWEVTVYDGTRHSIHTPQIAEPEIIAESIQSDLLSTGGLHALPIIATTRPIARIQLAFRKTVFFQ